VPDDLSTGNLWLFDTRTRKKQMFEPAEPDRVTMYVCGPTVYDLVHIGNARSAVVFDTLYRVLRHQYKRVDYVRNITDIDDKIIAACERSGEAPQSLTERYTAAYQADMQALGCLEPVHTPHATDYIEAMMSCIERLIQADHAYCAEGHVLFSVPSWLGYGSLSRRNPDEQLAGARIDPAPYKRDDKDFVLWKPSSDDQPGWESPWGRGRPGWHIECSAMSLELLGYPIDIHGGGSDLVFPHHENERAQSVCLHSGTHEFARFWLHNGMLTLGQEKMAKSRGNIRNVRDLLAEHTGETLRYALLSAHYRGPLAFSDKLLASSRTALFRLYETLIEDDRLPNEDTSGAGTGAVADTVWQPLLDDLNTPRAFAAMNKLGRETNRNAGEGRQALQATLQTSGRLLGLFSHDALQAYLHATRNLDARVLARLKERDKARALKDFVRSDAIRDELIADGYEIFDMGAAPSRAIRPG